MKNVLLLMALLTVAAAEARTDTLRVDSTVFVTEIKPVWGEYNRADTALYLYRIENGKRKYLLRHFTYRWSADCNNVFIDIGTFEVKNDSLVFLTKFTQKTGMDPIPDFRKQIYRVAADGKVMLLYDKQQERFSGEWVETNYKND